MKHESAVTVFVRMQGVFHVCETSEILRKFNIDFDGFGVFEDLQK